MSTLFPEVIEFREFVEQVRFHFLQLEFLGLQLALGNPRTFARASAGRSSG